jgi:ketol-acid reductoisomerase
METIQFFQTPVGSIVPTYIPANSTDHDMVEMTEGSVSRRYSGGSDAEIAEALLPLRGKVVYLYGFGAQSGNHARCLRSEDIKVKILGRSSSSKSMQAAIEDGFEVVQLSSFAPADADILCFGIPDEKQVTEVPNILHRLDATKTTLGFFHGMTVCYGSQGFYGKELKRILDGEPWNMFIVAPKGPGNTVWENKQAGGGIACLFGAHEDSPDYQDTDKVAIAYATALGAYKGIMLSTSFKEETETDHYGEQGVLCGVMFYATYFMIDRLQKEFGYSLKEAVMKVEEEVIKVGHLIRRGGASYAVLTASKGVIMNAKSFASQFYGQAISDDHLICSELEEIGYNLRRHQPHLSPVDSTGKVVAGEKLEAPEPLKELWEGGILGILLTASAMQYRLGVEAGYSREGMQFEIQQEIPLITDCYLRGGLAYMIMRISTTAKHGMLVSGSYVAKSWHIPIRARFATLLGAIQDGSYAKQTKRDLVDGKKDWLWEATLAILASKESEISLQNRPPTRKDFQGKNVETVEVQFGTEPWSYEFRSVATGEIIPA